ncbi:Alpha/beta hydrolase fold [Parasponia andersonii]|uniref:Alpha/beta hydrolase fold n=1 Tax=Parasponia andersonii TaxID=3476 RepID=A0A2P5CFA0_PARAD|nr:Alpha/beta hydrolase fold [Parasponia andersonii]
MVRDKKVVDEVSGWLRIYDDGSVDRTWTGPPEVKFMAEPVTPHDKFIDGVATRDVVADPNAGLRVRIYLPEKTPDEENTKLPIILHFHGGGFCISEANWFMYYTVYTRLAREAPAIIVSVYLRRAPEHRIPAAADDGHSALLWLSSQAKSRSEPWLAGADFNRVFLIGDSSGANLVHEVAARAGKEDLSPLRLAGAIPVHPGFVRPERSQSELEQPESPFLTLEMVDKFLGFALPVGSTKEHPMTCPMGPAAPLLECLKLPPVLLCIAEKDLIRDTEMEYYEAMKKANKDIELHLSPGMGHSFYLNKIAVDMDPDTAAQTGGFISRVIEFIKTH